MSTRRRRYALTEPTLDRRPAYIPAKCSCSYVTGNVPVQVYGIHYSQG